MTVVAKENRDSAEFAASLMETLCPSQRDRTLVLRQLLESIKVAAKISPDIWAVTLFDFGFRLNVGQVEVMTFRTVVDSQSELPQAELRLLLHGRVDEDMQTALNEAEGFHGISPSNYKSVPQPQFVYRSYGDISNEMLTDENYRELERALSLLQPMHANFIALAAKTPSGGTRSSTSFRRSHSPGLYSYAESFVSENWDIVHEQEEPTDLLEGRPVDVQATIYERNPMARQKCIRHYGVSCFVCGFNFGAAYGSAAKNYVQVHHLKPIAAIGKEYVIDPIEDLRPVCANCHAVIHLRQPPFSIDEVKDMLAGGSNA